MEFSLDTLSELMADSAVRGLSITRQLQPLGGRGDSVAPPTFAQAEGDEKGPRYVWSERRLVGINDDEMVKTCLLDSPASQANRIEEAFLEFVHSEELQLPLHQMDVPGIGPLTDLELPHRAYDATVGTAKLTDGTEWKKSELAKQLREASRKDARALLEHAPLILILGGWDSHSGTAANAWQGRHEKAVWSKIVAIDAYRMNRPGGRLDPMGLPSSYKADLGDGTKKLVDQGLGVVPPSLEKFPRLSVTMRYAEQRSVISFGVLRKIGFGGSDKNNAARVFLGALGILGLAALHRSGGHLRSECDLVCERTDGWQIRRDDAADEGLAGITVERALEVVEVALGRFPAAELSYRTEPIDLTVHENLVAAMGRSES